MGDNSFSIGGRDFQLSKLNAMKQYHVVRRISPILSDMLPAMKDVAGKKLDGLSDAEQLEQTIKVAQPIINGLSKLTDKDSEYVLYALLSCAQMKQDAGNWANLVSNDMLMFQDLELPLLLQVAGRSFMFNMAGFFGVLQQRS